VRLTGRFFLDVSRLAGHFALVVIAGTWAQIRLPWQVVQRAGRAGATRVDVHLEDNRSATSPPRSRRSRTR